MKKNVTIRIDENLVQKAKELGLNISKVSENALKEMIRRIESPSAPKGSKDCLENPQNSESISLINGGESPWFDTQFSPGSSTSLLVPATPQALNVQA